MILPKRFKCSVKNTLRILFLTLKIFFSQGSEKSVMNNVLEILQTIIIGAVVGTFLLNTGRIIKAEDISHECLVLLNGKALYKT